MMGNRMDKVSVQTCPTLIFPPAIFRNAIAAAMQQAEA